MCIIAQITPQDLQITSHHENQQSILIIRITELYMQSYLTKQRKFDTLHSFLT